MSGKRDGPATAAAVAGGRVTVDGGFGLTLNVVGTAGGWGAGRVGGGARG